MNLEDLIKEGVDTVVQEVPPRSGMANEVKRQARRQQAANAAVAGITTIAVAGGVLAVADSDPFGASVAPATGGQLSFDEPIPEVDPNKLPVRKPPQITWQGNGKVFFGDVTVPVDDHDVAYPTSSGALILTRSGEDGLRESTITKVDRNGNSTPLVSTENYVQGLAMSPSGDRVVWQEFFETDEGTGAQLVVADAESGERLFELDNNDGDVWRFVDEDRVVMEINDDGPLGIWNLNDDSVEPWLDYASVDSLATEVGIGTFTKVDSRGMNPTTAIVDTTTGQELWRVPWSELFNATVSPDGKYVAGLVNRAAPHDDQDGVVILDARTGDVVTHTGIPWADGFYWEPDGHLLAQSPENGDPALDSEDSAGSLWIRCDVDGDCERAGTPE